MGKIDRGKLGLVLVGRAMLSKSSIQFSIGGGQGLCSLPVIYLGPNYGEGNEDNGDLLQKAPCTRCPTQCPQPCIRPLPARTSDGDSWTLPGKSGSVSCGVIAPSSWVLVCKRFCLCPTSLFPCVRSGSSVVG